MRLRLDFRKIAADILETTYGSTKFMYQVPVELNRVSDLSHAIVQDFQLSRIASAGLDLRIDGYHLLPGQGIDLVREDDVLQVSVSEIDIHTLARSEVRPAGTEKSTNEPSPAPVEQRSEPEPKRRRMRKRKRAPKRRVSEEAVVAPPRPIEISPMPRFRTSGTHVRFDDESNVSEPQSEPEIKSREECSLYGPEWKRDETEQPKFIHKS